MLSIATRLLPGCLALMACATVVLADKPPESTATSTASTLSNVNDELAAVASAGKPDSADTADTADTNAIINGFHAEYELRYSGFRADVTLDLQAATAPDEYTYKMTTRARGIARLVRGGTATETSGFKVVNKRLQSLYYKLDDGTEKVENDTEILFDWEAGIAHSIYAGEALDLELQPDTLDRLTADIAAIQDLRNGQQPESYEVTDRNALRRYEFTAMGKETVTVPAGEFATVKFLRQRPGSTRATMIWYAPDIDFLVVRIEQLKRGETKIVMVATSIERAPACIDCPLP